MIYERSARIAAICQLLRGANGTVAWDTIASAAGAPLGEIRSAITSARKALERDDGIVFETVWGTGLRRLSDTDIVRSSHRYVQSINRKAEAGSQRLGAVQDYARLSPADQITSGINSAIFAAVRDQTRPAAPPEPKVAPHAAPDIRAIRT